MSNFADELFESTKQAIKEILKTDLTKSLKKFTFKDNEFKFEQDDILKTLPNIQAINLGVIKQVTVNNVDGEPITMSAEEYVERNKQGFQNKIDKEMDFEIINEILDRIETFTALTNFGSLEMAKDFYLEKIKEIKGIEEGE